MYGCPIASCTYENRLIRSVERHMEDHLDIHTVDPIRVSGSSETIWRCHDCPLTFPTQSRPRIHRVVHTDERSFECESCPFRTTRQDIRKSHQARHVLHAFPCFHCQFNGDTWDNTVIHMRISHSNHKSTLESRRQAVLKRTLENRRLVAAGVEPRRQLRRSVSRAGAAVLATAAADATVSANPTPQVQTATRSPDGQTRFQPYGICGHIYINAADFQLHDCERYAHELDESWENEFHGEDDL